MSPERRGPSRYSLSGTPADCVRIGLRQLVPDAGCVLSGINQGGNLGSDVFYSGTVAAVREGVLRGGAGNCRFPTAPALPGMVRLPHPEPGMRLFRWATTTTRGSTAREPTTPVSGGISLSPKFG